MPERREMSREERIEARHVLQETLERVRQLRDAMDPQHGLLSVTSQAFAVNIEHIVGPLVRLERKAIRDGKTL